MHKQILTESEMKIIFGLFTVIYDQKYIMKTNITKYLFEDKILTKMIIKVQSSGSLVAAAFCRCFSWPKDFWIFQVLLEQGQTLVASIHNMLTLEILFYRCCFRVCNSRCMILCSIIS